MESITEISPWHIGKRLRDWMLDDQSFDEYLEKYNVQNPEIGYDYRAAYEKGVTPTKWKDLPAEHVKRDVELYQEGLTDAPLYPDKYVWPSETDDGTVLRQQGTEDVPDGEINLDTITNPQVRVKKLKPKQKDALFGVVEEYLINNPEEYNTTMERVSGIEDAKERTEMLEKIYTSKVNDAFSWRLSQMVEAEEFPEHKLGLWEDIYKSTWAGAAGMSVNVDAWFGDIVLANMAWLLEKPLQAVGQGLGDALEGLQQKQLQGVFRGEVPDVEKLREKYGFERSIDYDDYDKSWSEVIDGVAQAHYDYAETFRRPEGSGTAGWIANTVGSVIPYVAASALAGFVTGGATAFLTGSKALATLGTGVGRFGVGYGIEGEMISREILDNGGSEEDAALGKFIGGTISGAIETLQVGGVLSFARGGGKKAAQNLYRNASKKAWKKVAGAAGKKRVGYEFIKHTINESLEEALQETTAIGVTAGLTGREVEFFGEDGKRVLMAAAGGAVGYGALGAAGRGFTRMKPLSARARRAFDAIDNQYERIPEPTDPARIKEFNLVKSAAKRREKLAAEADIEAGLPADIEVEEGIVDPDDLLTPRDKEFTFEKARKEVERLEQKGKAEGLTANETQQLEEMREVQDRLTPESISKRYDTDWEYRHLTEHEQQVARDEGISDEVAASMLNKAEERYIELKDKKGKTKAEKAELRWLEKNGQNLDALFADYKAASRTDTETGAREPQKQQEEVFGQRQSEQLDKWKAKVRQRLGIDQGKYNVEEAEKIIDAASKRVGKDFAGQLENHLEQLKQEAVSKKKQQLADQEQSTSDVADTETGAREPQAAPQFKPFRMEGKESTNEQIRKIHALADKVGFSEDQRRAFQVRVNGKLSTKHMNQAEANKVIEALERRRKLGPETGMTKLEEKEIIDIVGEGEFGKVARKIRMPGDPQLREHYFQNVKRAAKLYNKAQKKYTAWAKRGMGEKPSLISAMGSLTSMQKLLAKIDTILPERVGPVYRQIVTGGARAGLEANQALSDLLQEQGINPYNSKLGPEDHNLLKHAWGNPDPKAREAAYKELSPEGKKVYRAGELVAPDSEVALQLKYVLWQLWKRDKYQPTDFKDTEKYPEERQKQIFDEGTEAESHGQDSLLEWLRQQEWGTIQNYFPSESGGGRTISDIVVEGMKPATKTVQEEGGPGRGPSARPGEAQARKGTWTPPTGSAVNTLLNHMIRIKTAFHTFENVETFWKRFEQADPSKTDVASMTEAIGRALHRRETARYKFEEKYLWKTPRLFWRAYFANPFNGMWFFTRNIMQNAAYIGSQMGPGQVAKYAAMLTAERIRGTKSTLRESHFKQYWQTEISQKKEAYEEAMMHMKAEQTDVGTGRFARMMRVLDQMGKVAIYSDELNRMFAWNVFHRAAENELGKFRGGKIDYNQLRSRLKLDGLVTDRQMQLDEMLAGNVDNEFVRRYAEWKTANTHFHYESPLRGPIEQTRSMRILGGLMVYPRGVIEMTYHNGAKPFVQGIAQGDLNKAAQGLSSLLSLIVMSEATKWLVWITTGREAYGFLDTTAFGYSPLGPGVSTITRAVRGVQLERHKHKVGAQDFSTTASNVLEIMSDLAEVGIPLTKQYVNLIEASEDDSGRDLFNTVLEQLEAKEERSYNEYHRDDYEKIAHFMFGGFEREREKPILAERVGKGAAGILSKLKRRVLGNEPGEERYKRTF